MSYIDNLDRDIFPFVEYAGYSDRYPTKSALYLTKEKVDELRQASTKLFKIFCKTVEVFQKCPEGVYKDMEISDKLIPYLNIKNVMDFPTWFSRFDFVLDKNYNLKMVEINADTPCAVIESYYGNQVASDYFNKENPNYGENDKLKKWLETISYRCNPPIINLNNRQFDTYNRPFLFSCFHDYIEDYGTTMYLMNQLREQVGIDTSAFAFESFYNLAIDDNGILLPDGRHAGAIYRLHPMELLIEETTEDGSPLGIHFMDKYKEGKFSMFNPPESIIMQNKGFQALVWELSQLNNSVFTTEELKTIHKYMLPSHFGWDNVGEGNYIKKPIWGREGTGIKVVDNHHETVYTKEVSEDIVQKESNNYLYQEFVDQYSINNVDTDSGILSGYITLSCFMLGKQSSSVYCRFSEDKIAGTEAYWMPILYREE